MKDINLIREIAWSFHRSTKIDYNELFCEASLHYCEALRTYNPSKGKLSVWAYKIMNNHLIYFTKKEKHHNIPSSETVDAELVLNNDNIPFADFLENLPEDGVEIIKIILDSIEEFETDGPTKNPRHKVKVLLRDAGWKYPKIWDGMRNLKQALS